MRLVIVANRLPVAAEIKNHRVVINASPGGVVSGLGSYIESLQKTKKIEYLWIGWPGITLEAKEQNVLKTKLSKTLEPVFQTQEELDDYYYGFCNDTIWPLFHTFPSYANIDEAYWKSYLQVNKKFCEVAKKLIKPGDLVWIHDYHLMLLPKMLRDSIEPGIPIGFFLHIPFPEFEIFRLLPKPWREELLNGLLGSDLVAFHTYDYRRYFIDTAS